MKSRDKVSSDACDEAGQKWWNEYQGTPDFAESFKAGWDARDEQLLKLHGEGAMAEVIELRREVGRLKASEKDHLDDWKRIQDAERECERLREKATWALNTYGRHDDLCALRGGYGKCSCALDDTREAIKGKSIDR